MSQLTKTIYSKACRAKMLGCAALIFLSSTVHAQVGSVTRIEAEDYVAFQDSDAGNNGNAYRNDDVDIEATSDTGGGFNVGWTRAGEWLSYTVALDAGTYSLQSRVASNADTGAYSVLIDGQNVANYTVPFTGGWQNWETHNLGSFTADETKNYTFRVNISGQSFNLNWFQLTVTSLPSDSDEDGVTDTEDQCPNTPAGTAVDSAGCPLDTDNDGITDDLDACNNTPAGAEIDSNGCALDDDQDGVPNGLDQCLSTPVNYPVDQNGCALDSDNDGVLDGSDNCVDTPSGADVDSRGCPSDEDQDGVLDGIDQCPGTAPGVNVDALGCLVVDSDGDGIDDDVDACPNTSAGASVDPVGCVLIQNVTIQAEDYINYSDSDAGNNGGDYRNDDVDIQATTDSGGGYNVGWTNNGEWLEFNVDLSAGTYQVSARVASESGPGSYNLVLNGNTIGSDAAGNTGGWQNWETHTVGNISVARGTHTLRVNMTSGALNLNWIRFNATQLILDSDQDGVIDDIDQCPNTPPGSNVDASGCVSDSDGDGIQDDLDNCDNTPVGADVDAQGCPSDTDGDGVFDGLDSCDNTVNSPVNSEGCSEFQIDDDNDGVSNAEDNCDNTPTGAIPDDFGCPTDSDGDGVWDGLDQCENTPSGTTIDSNGCAADSDQDGVIDDEDLCENTPAGLVVDANGCPIDSDGDGVNDDIDSCPNTPAGEAVDAQGCPVVTALKVQVEDYVNFNDSDAGNNGEAYRNDDVDIQATTDTDGGFNVGWTEAGEWLEYDLNVIEGIYRITSRVASQSGGGSFNVLIDGTLVASDSIEVTGGWQAWQTQDLGTAAIQAGNRTLRIEITGGGFNLNWLNFEREGAIVDSDGDGIDDSRDECPNTTAGVSVDSRGCEILPNTILSGAHKIRNVNSGKCVEVENGNPDNGANVQQNTCNDSDLHFWDFTHLGDDVYSIKNVQTGKLLDVEGGGTTDNVQQWGNDITGDANRWRVQVEGSSYTIRALSDESECLDIANGSSSNGANVGTANCNGTNAQAFDLISLRPANSPCWPGEAPTATITKQRYWSNINFDKPLDIVQEPQAAGDDWFVVEKNGRVLRLLNDPNDSTVRTFMTVPNLWLDGEGGMAAMEFDPDYGVSNQYIYVTYTANSPRRLRLSRFETNAAGTSVNMASELHLFSFPIDTSIHNSGDLVFGPGPVAGQTYLYMSVGDDGSNGSGDTNPVKVQQNNAPNGKILRLAPEHYRSPTQLFEGFPSDELLPYVVAKGFRNPWRMSFDGNDLWIANVGFTGIEEINVMNVQSQIGANYGWPYCEGTTCCTGSLNCSLPGLPSMPNNLVAPLYSYTDGGAKAVIGGYVYRGTELSGYQGLYVYADYVQQTIFTLDPQTRERTQILSNNGAVADFGIDHDNEIYFVDHGNGRIYKIVAGAEQTSAWPPQNLIETGCFTSLNNGEPLPSSNVRPFDVAQLFWSDGAHKERLVAIPQGTTINVDDPNNFVLPPGGVTIKNFFWNDEIFETRFFVRHTGGEYAGYTYRWDGPNTATLVPASGDSKQLDGIFWNYPSRSQCLACHTEAVGGNIALEARQMNVGTQLADLFDAGWLNAEPENLQAFPPRGDTTESLETRALAYLHVNCANCHRGDESDAGRAFWDARFDVPLAQKEACNVTPVVTVSGDAQEAIIKTGRSDLSTVWLRAHQRESQYTMPPIGSVVADAEGMDLLIEWIDQLTGCQ